MQTRTETHTWQENLNQGRNEQRLFDHIRASVCWAGVEQFGREARRESRVRVGESGIKEEGRVTFYFRRLGRQQPWFSVMPHFPHWTWEREKGKRERGNKGWHGLQGWKDMCSAVLSFQQTVRVFEWKTGSDVHIINTDTLAELCAARTNKQHVSRTLDTGNEWLHTYPLRDKRGC